MTATAANTEVLDRLERETCSRCGGGGSYSWCQSHGSRCFKCGGKGEVLTKRGHAANLYLRSLMTVSVASLEPGDVVRVDGMTAGCQMYTCWATVTEVRDEPDNVNGHTVVVVTKDKFGGCEHHKQPTATLQVRFDVEKRREHLAEALKYQAGLTKAGKRRKRRRKA